MEEQLDHTHDRGLDYQDTKDKLTNKYNELINTELTKKTLYKIIYVLIACLQLRNGSRISEAIKAFKLFLSGLQDKQNKVIVKISKSDGLKKRKDGTVSKSKARFRKLKWMDWVDIDLTGLSPEFTEELIEIDNEKLRKRVLKYLLDTWGFNTHSLRYACIDYMINVQNVPTNNVAKFVGHVDLSMIVRYTQRKQTDKMFDLDM